MPSGDFSVTRLLVSFVVGTVGFYMLIRGKKTAEPVWMVLGGALMITAYWIG